MRTLLVVFAVACPAFAQDWKPVTTALLQQEKPGYGGLCGVVVDPATGDVYVNVSDRGVFRSADAGRTWTRLGDALKGRTETAGCLQLDPTGKTKRLATALVYGSPVAATTTDGGTWKIFDKASAHTDWFAADWTDPEMKFVLALKHESGGLLLRSRDGGKTFDELGKGFGPAWVFDATTAVVAKAKGVVRTTDGGTTFSPAAEFTPKALPRWHGDTLYWLADDALYTTTDRGATWARRCDLKGGRFGPVFGQDAKHLLVLTTAGVVESTDAGTTWARPVPLPKELKGVSPLTWLAYDPVRDAVYVMKMTTELFRLARKTR